MVDRDNDIGATATRNRPTEGKKKRGILPWLIALLVIAAIVVAGFFLLGGDVDSDTQGEFDIDVPESDIDVDGPDVDAEAPDVDVDPGSVDVDEGDAEADAGN